MSLSAALFRHLGTWPRGLRSRLVALILLAIVPALVLVIDSGMTERRLAETAAHDAALRVTKNAASTLDRGVDDAHDVLATLAVTADLPGASPAACEAQFAAVHTRLQERGVAFTVLGVAAPDGTLTCSSPPLTEPVNVADRLYFRRAVETGQFVVGDFVIGRVSHRPSFNVGMPDFDGQGNLRAVLVAGLDFSWLEQIVADAQLPDGSTVLALDGQGLVLARYPDPDGWTGWALPPDQPLRQVIGVPTSQTVELAGLDAIPRLYAVTPIAGGGVVIVGVPRTVAFAEANRLLIRNIVGLLAATALALAAAWFGSLAFALRPLHQLVTATRQLANGDLSARSALRGAVEELAALGTAFDQMAGQLADRETARAQAEAERQESETHHGQVLASLAEVVFQTDLEGRWRFLSPAWTRIMGLPIEESLGTSYLDRVHPAERVASELRFAGLRDGTLGFCRQEMRFLAGTDAVRWLEVYANATHDEHGQITGLAGTLTNVTDRHQMEDALRGSETRLRLALEAVDDGVWDLDLLTGGLYVSPRWYAALGYEPDEMPPTADVWDALVHPDDLPIVAAMRAGDMGGDVLAQETELRVPDQERPVALGAESEPWSSITARTASHCGSSVRSATSLTPTKPVSGCAFREPPSTTPRTPSYSWIATGRSSR